MFVLILIVFVPIAAALLAWCLQRGAQVLALGAAGFSALAGTWLLVSMDPGGTRVLDLWKVGGFQGGFAVDAGDAIVATVVGWVAVCVFVYSIHYMRGKGHALWFWATMSLFLSAMQLLVLAGDWVTFLVGWELMGCASFLLIATEHEEAAARAGALKAFLLTRSTDLGLYVGLFSLIGLTGTVSAEAEASVTLGGLGATGFIVAAMGKSAQVPFQSWLRGAMAGPTPVSALLHSATMVAAGALLLIRIRPMLGSEALQAIAIVGGVTAILVSVTAIVARDLKHLLAASTSSQLGLMFFALGLGGAGAALAHWLAHAFMKSALFLGAGLFQERFGTTEMGRLRGAGRRNRLALGGFAVAGLALAGLPPLIGYKSKDALLGVPLDGTFSAFTFSVALLAALGTAIYVGRACWLLWRGDAPRPREKPVALMLVGLGGLGGCILLGGFGLEAAVKRAGYAMPHHLAAQIGGGVTLVLGLLIGMWLARCTFRSSVSEWIRGNFALGTGYRGWVGRPVLGLAGAAAQIETGLDAAVGALGAGGMRLAEGVRQSLEAGLEATVCAVGRGEVALAALDRRTLEQAIDDAVDGLAGASRAAGERARRWQSGMVHEELLITVSAGAGAVVILILTLFVS